MGRRRAFTTATAKVHELYRLTQAEPMVDLAPSENEFPVDPDIDANSCASSLRRSSCSHENHVLRDPSPEDQGPVSLVKPVTSMDRFRSIEQYASEEESFTPSIQNQPERSKMRARRAPSTGQHLHVIREEPSLEANLVHHDLQPLPVEAVLQASQVQRRPQSQRSHAVLPSSSLIETSTETFPPFHRRHAIVDTHVFEQAIDDLDAFADLDEDDLMELECHPISHTTANLQQAIKASTSLNKIDLLSLPTPAASDDPLLEDLAADDFLQLSDIEPEVVDLTDSPVPLRLNESNTEAEHQLAVRHACSILDAYEETQNCEGIAQNDVSSSLNLSSANIPAPFARSEFPDYIRDRSPLLNILPSLALKTCFRIGEAINIGAKYARESSTFTSDAIVIELYARVVSSWRPEDQLNSRQNFILADLWSEKAPQLHGYWIAWKGSKLYDADARNLLTGTGIKSNEHLKMCRLIGKMKREKQKWEFVILNAWECDWDDVEYVRAIICHD